jgi:ubiquitin-protein ligase
MSSLNAATSSSGEASAATLRRLMKEFQAEQKQVQAKSGGAGRDENVLQLAPRDTEGAQLLEWTAAIRGPPGGAYEGGFDFFACTSIS